MSKSFFKVLMLSVSMLADVNSVGRRPKGRAGDEPGQRKEGCRCGLGRSS
jgi:hypothetical protein